MLRRIQVLVIVIAALLFMTASPADAQEELWDSFTLAPKLGYVYNHAWGGTPNRHGMKLQLEFDLGGFAIAPTYTFENPNAGDDIHGLGAFFGYMYRGEVGRAYIYGGIGSKIAYLFCDDFDHGVQILARIPLGVTYYILDDLGIVVEGGFGYGFTSSWGGGSWSTSALSGFDHGFYADLVAGIRWP